MRGWRTGLWSVAVVSMLVLVLGACGDDAGDALDKAEFLARGNQVCAGTEENIRSAADSAFPEQGTIPSIEQIEAFATGTVAPEVQKQIDELRKLTPPTEDRGRVNEILSQAQRGVDAVRNDPTSIMTPESSPFARYDELASDYGLKTCGEASAHTRELMSGKRR